MNLISKIAGKCLRRLERMSGRNYVNPLLTLYVNLRLLPLSKALRFPIWVYGRPHLIDLSGRVRFSNGVSSGLVRLNVVDLTPAQRGSRLELAIAGEVEFGGRALIRSNTKIYVDNGATLSIGHNLRLGAGIIINCLNEIYIGEGVRIGHRSQLLDSNMHFTINLKTLKVAPMKKRIVIGEHSWLTNSVSIYGGAVVPPYSIVASGTLVNKDLSAMGSDNVLGGNPCRVLCEGVRLVNNYDKELEIGAFYKANPSGVFFAEQTPEAKEWFENP